ncbi:hypothetical protein B0J17DRAFT_149215 [Rhizoctonia solani]|nr:hypothetical protein B0J17DRAFT_149215 [Rhizoctonia solani]
MVFVESYIPFKPGHKPAQFVPILPLSRYLSRHVFAHRQSHLRQMITPPAGSSPHIREALLFPRTCGFVRATSALPRTVRTSLNNSAFLSCLSDDIPLSFRFRGAGCHPEPASWHCPISAIVANRLFQVILPPHSVLFLECPGN